MILIWGVKNIFKKSDISVEFKLIGGGFVGWIEERGFWLDRIEYKGVWRLVSGVCCRSSNVVLRG